MQNPLTQIGNVSYNAANQCFEALVTFHIGRDLVRVASAFSAPMNSSFKVIAGGLTRIALREMTAGRALLSRRVARAEARSPAPAPRWQRQLSGRRAA